MNAQDLNAHMNVMLEHMDTASPEDAKEFALHVLQAASERTTAEDEAIERVRYFLKTFEYNGVGNTIARLADSPDTVVALTREDLQIVLATLK